MEWLISIPKLATFKTRPTPRCQKYNKIPPAGARNTDNKYKVRQQTCCTNSKLGPAGLCPFVTNQMLSASLNRHITCLNVPCPNGTGRKCIYSKLTSKQTIGKLYYRNQMFICCVVTKIKFSYMLCYRPGGHRSVDANGPTSASH